jgi:SAM-dependent methyltransferase
VLQHEYEVMHAQEMSHWWFRGRRRVLIDLLRRATAGTPRPRILDFGCGTGGNAEALACVGEVTGVEPNAGALALAHARGAGRYCRGSGTSLPFTPAAFDAVVASDVLEHIGDDAGAVSEIARVLRPGGALVFSVPAHPWLFAEHDTALWHHRRYTRATLRRLLADGGLAEEFLSYWNATLFPMVCAYRFLAPLLRREKARSDVGATPQVVNAPLTAVLSVEAAILRHTRLPWGVSFVGIARRR